MKLIKKLLFFLMVLLVGFAGGAMGTYFSTQHTNQNQLSTSSPADTVLHATKIQTSTTDAVQTIQEAVVSVANYQTVSDSLSSIYSRIFGTSPTTNSDSDGELELYGEGSGVIYKKDEKFAYLVTNNHVVEGAEKLEIILSDGTRLDGELVGADTYSDLAVVRIDAEAVTVVGEFADSASLTLGEPALAIGSPLGSEYANSVTEGIVSGLSRTVTLANEQGETISTNAIQTDAAINQGNSGGPLVNIQGQIIGINSSKISSSSGNVAVEGMGFAIPSNDVIAIINQLENSGHVVRPALGINMVSLAEVSSSVLSELKLPDHVTNGIIVANVQSGLPADGKLEQYDVLTAIDGEEISSGSDLQSILYKHQLGDSITISIYRGQEQLNIDIQLTKTTQDLTNE